MTNRNTLSMAAMTTVGGLIAAAAGIVIQIASGIDFPTIPPGLSVTIVPAILIAVAPWRWTPIVGVLAGLSLFIGLFLSGEADRLLDPTPLGGFLGLWLMVVAEIVIIVAGTVATVQNYRRARTQPRR